MTEDESLQQGEPVESDRISLADLLAGYLEQPMHSRAAWIRAAAHGDALLVARVEHLAQFARAQSDSPWTVGDLLPKDVLPTFEIRQLLARGGMSDVYLAFEHSPPRAVALKVMRPLGTFHWRREQFAREVAAVALIDHPAVVRIFGNGILQTTGAERPWLSMELVRGARTLSQVVRDDCWSVSQVIEAISEVSDAVATAHAAGVVHGDLSGNNILVDTHGRIRLIDFGISRLAESDLPRVHFGTPTTSSPEQLRGQRLEPASDVFSLGTLLAQLTSQANQGVDGSETKRDELIRADVDAVLVRATETHIADRYPTAALLRADLQALLDHREVSCRSGTTLESLRRWRKRSPEAANLTVALLTVLLMAALGGLSLASIASREARAAVDARRSAYLQLAEKDCEDGALNDATRVLMLRGILDGSLEEQMVRTRIIANRTVLDRSSAHVYSVATLPGSSDILKTDGVGVGRLSRAGSPTSTVIARWLPESQQQFEAFRTVVLNVDAAAFEGTGNTVTLFDPRDVNGNIKGHITFDRPIALTKSSVLSAYVVATDNAVTVIDSNGTMVNQWPVSTVASPHAVAVSPDGKRIAIGGSPGALWISPLPCHAGIKHVFGGKRIWGVAWSPDSQRIACIAHDGVLRVFDGNGSGQLLERQVHSTEGTAITWSPDGSQIATCGSDRQIVVTDAVTLRAIAAVPCLLGRPWDVQWDGAGLLIAEHGGIERVDPTQGPLERLGDARDLQSPLHGWTVTRSDRNRIAISHADGSPLRSWTWDEGRNRSLWPFVMGIGLTADGQGVLVCTNDGRLLRMEPQKEEPTDVWNTPLCVYNSTAVVEFPGCPDALFASLNGDLRRINRQTGETRWQTAGYSLESCSVTLSRDMQRVVAAWRDGRVAVFDANDGSLRLETRCAPLRPQSLQWLDEDLVVDCVQGRYLLSDSSLEP